MLHVKKKIKEEENKRFPLFKGVPWYKEENKRFQLFRVCALSCTNFKNNLRNYIYSALLYFHFCQNFEITILAKFLNIVAKFGKLQSINLFQKNLNPILDE